MPDFEPNIVGIMCNWCSYEAADNAGRGHMHYPANIRIVRVMCTGRLDPVFVLNAFREGADGVLIAGCHPDECHYKSGNYYAKKRFVLLKDLLGRYGINEERVRLEWISAAESEKFVDVIKDFTKRIRELGKLNARWD